MNWSDERYVRLYLRDTVTWRAWSWQTRAVLPLLLRKVDRAGVLDTGATNKADALALIVEVPTEVAQVALRELLSCGTVVENASTLSLPSFIAAQEARQSDRTRQAESRANRARRAREAASPGTDSGACHTPSHAVTGGHSVPCRAEPCLAEPSGGGEEPPPPLVLVEPAAGRVPDRLKPLAMRLVERYSRERGSTYKHGGAKDTQALKGLISIAEDLEIEGRWVAGLRLSKFPRVSSFAQLAQRWNDLAPPARRFGPGSRPPRSGVTCALCGAAGEAQIWEQDFCHPCAGKVPDVAGVDELRAWLDKERARPGAQQSTPRRGSS